RALPRALAMAEQQLAATAAGQDDMFGLAPEVAKQDDSPIETVAEWPDAVRLQAEKDTLGLYLTGHPINAYVGELKHLVSGTIAELVRDAAATSGSNGFGQNG